MRSDLLRRGICLLGLVFVLDVGPASAQEFWSQLPNPRLLTLLPGGGRPGSTVEVTCTGTELEEIEAVLFSHPGLKAEVLLPPPPPPDPKKNKPTAKPTLTRLKVTIAADAPLGNHDVRLVNKHGVSNPRAFVVGDLKEVLEKEPNNDVAEAQRVDLDTTVNGAVTAATDVDYFVFTARQGQRVVVACRTSSIDSRLPAALDLYNSAGKRLTGNRYYQEKDAVLDYTATADGDYVIRLTGFTYVAGSPEYFYRLSITTAPWIDAIHPPMVEPGKPTRLTILGRNLPGGQLDPTEKLDGQPLEKIAVTVNVPNDPAALVRLQSTGHVPAISSGLDGFEFRLKNAAGSSNPFLLTYARAPIVRDNDNNDTPETAQEVPIPCEIAGRIEKRLDRDWFSFSAKKGEVLHIECFSDRLGAASDMVLLLRQVTAKSEEEFDDVAEELHPLKFYTRSKDPGGIRLEVKADGKYQLLVRSQNGDVQAGPRHFYRLSITPEKPDFRLIVLPPAERQPDTCRLPRGGYQAFTVALWRIDGFAGEVAITVEGLPAGVTCAPQLIGPNQNNAPLVLQATSTASLGVHALRIKGTATIAGQTVVREARPAGPTWSTQERQNVPAISRLERQLFFSVREQGPFVLSASLDKTELFPGDKAKLTVKLTRQSADFKTTLAATPLDLPVVQKQPFINLNNILLSPGKDEATAIVEVKANTAPGTYNLALRGSAQVPYSPDPAAKQKPNLHVILPSSPISLTIHPRTLAAVSLNNSRIQAKLGSRADILVSVKRLFGYTGAFKVQLVPPANLKGFSADEVAIPPGRDEITLVVRVAPDAPVGTHTNFLVRATAVYHGKITTTQETNLGIKVTK